MAVETGKFLSLSGLGHYDSKIKAWVEAKKYGLASDILDINTKLSNYDTVTSNAAAGKAAADAWTIFLAGSNFSNSEAPKLVDLATTASVNTLLESYYTKTQVDNIKGELEDKITAAGTNLTDNYYTKTNIDDKVAAINKTASDNLAEAKSYTDTLKNTEVKANTEAISELTETVAGNKAAAEKLVDDLSKGQVTTNKNNIEGLTTRMGTAENNITSIQGWKINGNAITATTKLNATNLPMSDAEGAATISAEISDIKAAISGGTHFVGVLEALPASPNAGDIFVASKDIPSGGVTYKKDLEYIYDGTKWYELGDSSANAEAISNLNSTKADKETTYTKTDVDGIKGDLETAISTLEGKTVKSVEGDASSYVTIEAAAKDADGKVKLTVTDTIADNFLGINAKAKDSAKLNGQEASYYATAQSVSDMDAAYKLADTGLSDRIKAVEDVQGNYVLKTEFITESEINALFA